MHPNLNYRPVSVYNVKNMTVICKLVFITIHQQVVKHNKRRLLASENLITRPFQPTARSHTKLSEINIGRLGSTYRAYDCLQRLFDDYF